MGLKKETLISVISESRPCSVYPYEQELDNSLHREVSSLLAPVLVHLYRVAPFLGLYFNVSHESIMFPTMMANAHLFYESLYEYCLFTSVTGNVTGKPVIVCFAVLRRNSESACAS